MQMSNSTTWWLTLALVAVQGLTSIAWASLGLDPRWVAGIGQFSSYASLLLLFAIHGTVPGVAPVIMPKVVIAFLVVGLSVVLASHPAAAETRQPIARPMTGDPIKDIGNALHPDIPAQSGQTVVNKDLLDSLNDKLLSDLLADVSYADARAHVVGNVVTIPCWDAWKTLLTQQNSPLKDDAGNVMTKPDPHVITTAEFASEILRQLQPDSSLSLGCAPMLQAMQKDISTMIGAVLSGGALGLFKLPIAIP